MKNTIFSDLENTRKIFESIYGKFGGEEPSPPNELNYYITSKLI